MLDRSIRLLQILWSKCWILTLVFFLRSCDSSNKGNFFKKSFVTLGGSEKVVFGVIT